MSDENLSSILNFRSWSRNIGVSALELLIRLAFCIALYFAITRILGKILDTLDRHLKKRGTAPTVRHFMHALIKAVVLGFTIVTMVIQLHIVEASSIAALVAAAGVGISLAVQGVLSNFAGGVLLLLLNIQHCQHDRFYDRSCRSYL